LENAIIINEIMQVFGNLDKLSFVRIRRLNWIGHVNRMGGKRKVRHVFYIHPQGSQLTGWPKYRWRSCVQTDIYKGIITNQKHNKINGDIWRHFGKQMNKETKWRIHNITAKAASKLGSEAWVLRKREEQCLETA